MKYKLTLTDEDGVVRRTWDLSTIEADWRETEPDYWPAPVRSLGRDALVDEINREIKIADAFTSMRG